MRGAKQPTLVMKQTRAITSQANIEVEARQQREEQAAKRNYDKVTQQAGGDATAGIHDGEGDGEDEEVLLVKRKQSQKIVSTSSLPSTQLSQPQPT